MDTDRFDEDAGEIWIMWMLIHLTRMLVKIWMMWMLIHLTTTLAISSDESRGGAGAAANSIEFDVSMQFNRLTS